MSEPVPLPAHTPQTELTRLDTLWEKYMQNSQSCFYYQKTAALLVSWLGSDLDREGRKETLHQEVNDLATVLRDDYHFDVETSFLGHKKPIHELSKNLSNFLLQHDDPGTLLIIYYAGHGSSHGGTFKLHRSTNEASQSNGNGKFNSITWAQVESLLKERESDLLAIFDCCDAGNLCHFRGPLRFEYLGSCCDGQETPPPGPNSFTTALTWALKDLKKSAKGWFSTPELRDKIKKYENFPAAQWPHLGHRELESATLGHIVIAPSKRDIAAEDSQLLTPFSQDVNLHFLDLRFHFHEDITEEALESLAKNIKLLVNDHRTSAKRVTFVAKRSGRSVLQKAVNKWRDHTRSRRDKRKSSLEHLSTERSAAELMPLTPRSDVHSKFTSDISDADTEHHIPAAASNAASSEPISIAPDDPAPPSRRPKRDRPPGNNKESDEPQHPPKRRKASTRSV